ncbi:MAG: hypothetical protein HGB08_00370 [Candidatus Moranbacteria bacterium]|nr:hypothetical protein [Candidatus Moranbacteria bacterium]
MLGKSSSENYRDIFEDKADEYSKKDNSETRDFSGTINLFTSGTNKERYVIRKATVEKHLYVRKSN